MNDKPGSSFWRWFRRIALVVFILFALAIGAGILYLQTLPLPSPQTLAAAGQRYRDVRRLLPSDPTTTGSLGSSSAATHAAGTSDSLQTRCDQLFTHLAQIKFDPYSGEQFPRFTQSDLDNAKALAALYDLGVHVSPEAQRGYRLGTHGRTIMFMAQAITLDIKPDDSARAIHQKSIDNIIFMDAATRARRVERYVESLKFLRVANCPTSRMSTSIRLTEDQYFEHILPSKVEPHRTVPEMNGINPELLAPREPLDWDRFLALELDWRREDCAGAERLITAGGAFRYFKTLRESELESAWYKPVLTNLSATAGAIIMPRQFGSMLESPLRIEQSIQNYVEAYKTNTLTPSIVAQAQFLNFHNEQIMSRLHAAGIELRQGKPLPSLETIDSSSYYFDPVTQRPYLLRVMDGEPGYVNLSICRPIQQSGIVKNGKTIKVEGRAMFTIVLPANHPGLERIPRM